MLAMVGAWAGVVGIYFCEQACCGVDDEAVDAYVFGYERMVAHQVDAALYGCGGIVESFEPLLHIELAVFYCFGCDASIEHELVHFFAAEVAGSAVAVADYHDVFDAEFVDANE